MSFLKKWVGIFLFALVSTSTAVVAFSHHVFEKGKHEALTSVVQNIPEEVGEETQEIQSSPEITLHTYSETLLRVADKDFATSSKIKLTIKPAKVATSTQTVAATSQTSQTTNIISSGKSASATVKVVPKAAAKPVVKPAPKKAVVKKKVYKNGTSPLLSAPLIDPNNPY